MQLVDQLEQKWVPEGHPVLDLVPPDFKAPADMVFKQQMRSPVVTKRNFWSVFKTMRDNMDRTITGLPPTFVGQMGSALDDDENRHREVVDLLEGYRRLRRRPTPHQLANEDAEVIDDEDGYGDGEGGYHHSDWDPEGEEDSEYDFEGDEPLLEVQLTEDEE